jgi:hypothetical protein
MLLVSVPDKEIRTRDKAVALVIPAADYLGYLDQNIASFKRWSVKI